MFAMALNDKDKNALIVEQLFHTRLVGFFILVSVLIEPRRGPKVHSLFYYINTKLMKVFVVAAACLCCRVITKVFKVFRCDI